MDLNVLNLDPVKRLLRSYPRIVVIKAALQVLRSGRQINTENIEKAINDIMNNEKDDEEEGRD
ncbi:hypothetical protein Theth_1945 [Pseudothermotoga thermarum DSM 5069]|uniref:Uncharacterized protein n=1 Tax=Pseudothermotoga thermarum DSM 5069 TaxID=688269 RepID=F7YWK4_9THEM|nr:hypothetical protein [Pseudothermotoga thermarum]AEH51985.1 hypothetical protein Theth_1945 [Pseudothermotoga thermarum DSM 5069]